MSELDMNALYLSIDSFYDMRGGRWSGESDFGVHWRDGKQWPRYRVSVVRDTGDVYAVNQQTGAVELLGNVKPEPVRDGGDGGPYSSGQAPVDVYDVAELLLAGWAQPEIHELAWVRERLA